MNLQALLVKELENRRRKNARYSLRGFAKSLGIHSSTLTRILNGSRRVTPDLADRVLKRIEMDPSLKSTILLSLHEAPPNPKKFDAFYKALAPNSVSALNGWHHFAILSAFEIQGFQPTVRWIAEYFSLPEDKVSESLNLLQQLRLIRKEKGKWVARGEATTSHAAKGHALAKIHREYIQKASKALERSRKDDDFSGITMSINKKKLPEAVRRIQEFRRNLADYLCGVETTELHEVYRLNIQLFSLCEAQS